MASPDERGNVAQAAVWDGAGGEHRLRHPDQDDAEVRRHNERLREAAAIGAYDRVLDIGCGTGQSTRDAARAAVKGSAHGVDLSAAMLKRARALSAAEGLRNVTFVQADAQVHPFPAARFDVGLSRFGVMFFSDPVAAFANIGRALRPSGRLVLMVWQGRERNDWALAISHALATEVKAPPAAPGMDSFSLGEQDTVRRILDAAGYGAIALADVHEPIYLGRDATAAYDFVSGLWSTRQALASMEPVVAERASDRLRGVLAAQQTGEGVLFDSRAWIVTAVRG